MPIAATLLGKSLISEVHPQYLGIYEGATGREDVRRIVEASDCLLILGTFLTDIDMGIFSARIDPHRTIDASSERIIVRHHKFEDVQLCDFILGLMKADTGAARKRPKIRQVKHKPFRLRPCVQVTVKRLFERMNEFLDDDTMVICDIGDSLFGAADLTIHRRTEFISPAYYRSMGFATPAALGAQIGKRGLRPLVFLGDGASQMTGQELSTIARHGLNPIFIVLNNKGYSTERFINDGPYDDILDWAYHKWPILLRYGWGGEVRTEGELEVALKTARENTSQFSIINVHLDPYDRSSAMERLGKRLGERASLKRKPGAKAGKQVRKSPASRGNQNASGV